MQILLTIFVLSIATFIGCVLYESLDPRNDTNATVGAVAVIMAFLSGLLSTLVFIWN